MTAALGLTPAQLEQRKGKIGASNAAAILGMSPYRGPMDEWLRLTGREVEAPRSPALEEAAMWGHRIEGPLCDDYSTRHGVHVRTSGTIVHPTIPWLLATPDRLVYTSPQARGAPRALLQAKNRSWHLRNQWGPSGSDDIPDEVRCQVVVEIAVASAFYETSLPYADVVALVGGNSGREYRVIRDMDTEYNVLGLLQEFWDRCVVADQPPDIDGSHGWEAYLQRTWTGGKKGAPLLPAPSEAEEIAHELARLKVLAADTEQRIKVERQRMEALIGHSGGAGFKGDGWQFRWSERKGSVAWKRVAMELGATDADAEKHRGQTFRVPTFRHEGVEDDGGES